MEMTAEYELTYVCLHDELNRDDAWRAWWAPTGRQRLEISFNIVPAEAEYVSVRRGSSVVQAVVVRPTHGFASAPEASEPQRAYDDIRTNLGIVQDRLKLPPTPPLPPLPVLDENDLRAMRAVKEAQAAEQRWVGELAAWLNPPES
ncbi:hypothetical protein [Dactylosporangium salmoneum]|uniref:hypothetical protein n=1 Tax=Dactylosporangium salmoneum TaxID=53361 RepID=UPI0031CFB34F